MNRTAELHAGMILRKKRNNVNDVMLAITDLLLELDIPEHIYLDNPKLDVVRTIANEWEQI